MHYHETCHPHHTNINMMSLSHRHHHYNHDFIIHDCNGINGLCATYSKSNIFYNIYLLHTYCKTFEESKHNYCFNAYWD